MGKKKKAQEGHDAAKIAKLFNLDINTVSEAVEVYTPQEQLEREADAVIDYIYNPSGWYDKECSCCGKKFATNFRFVGVCSLLCRKSQLEAVGLRWDSTRTEDQRWKALKIEPPGVVPPAAYDAIKELIRLHQSDPLPTPASHILTL